MARVVELRRHTAAEGDVLTPEGVRAAVEIGRRLSGRYDLLVSSGAQRATQTLACLLAAGTVRCEAGVVVDPGFRSTREEEWFAVARHARSGSLEAFRAAAPDLVAEEAHLLGEALRRTFAALPPDGRALVVGHSPMHECAILGLTGVVVDPIAKGGAVLVIETEAGYRVEPVA
jgi:broad specificity phosphatase PhoE